MVTHLTLTKIYIDLNLCLKQYVSGIVIMIFADMIPIALKLQKWQIAIFSVVRPIRVATLQPLILILWIIFILNGK